MRRTPILCKKRTQRCQHAGLELSKIYSAFGNSGDSQRQDFALLVQAGGIRDVGHDVVKATEHLLHPSTGAKAHDCRIEPEHVREGCRHVCCVQGITSIASVLATMVVKSGSICGLLEPVAVVVVVVVLLLPQGRSQPLQKPFLCSSGVLQSSGDNLNLALLALVAVIAMVTFSLHLPLLVRARVCAFPACQQCRDTLRVM
mmetsp:Transcript_115633/g.200757  ORF Transcript_115633/g.200757 Transcript_115633/m.200757 type:complete len:201 (-) Transcript_115633:660-1262(-)